MGQRPHVLRTRTHVWQELASVVKDPLVLDQQIPASLDPVCVVPMVPALDQLTLVYQEDACAVQVLVVLEPLRVAIMGFAKLQVRFMLQK